MNLHTQTIVALTVLALTYLLLPAPVPAQVSETTLDNGLRIIVAESHEVPIVAVDVWVRAGTRRQPPGQPGVAHFLEHLLFKGTPSHPTEESVDGSIEDLGGSLDAATSYDWAHFYTEIPNSGCADAIALLADVLQHSTLSAASVEQERPVILDEIDRASQDPAQSLTDTARTLMYSHVSSYAGTITGTDDNVRAVTRDEILAFYKSYYVPNNITLVVSGDVKAATVQQIAQQDFGAWKRSPTLLDDGEMNASTYAAQSSTSPNVYKQLIQSNADESYVVMAFQAPSVRQKPDTWDMDVLLTLLGQGGNNRLNTDLKLKQRLVTSIEADYLTQRDPGILTITASMPTANIDSVQNAIINQIVNLRTQSVSQPELTAAKLALKASYLFDVDTDSGHADSLGFYDSIDSYQYDVDYLDHINSVTADDVLRIANKYLSPTAYSLVLQVPLSDPATASTADSTPLTLVSAESSK